MILDSEPSNQFLIALDRLEERKQMNLARNKK